MQRLVAIKNFWNLQDSNAEAFEAIYKAMIGGAYPRSEIDKALEECFESQDEIDMSEAQYLPVLTEQQTKGIERRFNVKLRRANITPKIDISDTLYELT